MSGKKIVVKLCPFCRTHLTPINRMFEGKWDKKLIHYIQCKICKAQGPLSESLQEAADMWNMAKRDDDAE